MGTLEQELAELRAKQAKKEAELVREHAILTHFGEFLDAGYGRPMIHFSRLYGQRGSVYFNWQNYDSIRKGKNPDASLLARLLERFPGEPKVMYRDSCVGMRAEGNALEAQEKARECGMSAEVTPVEPVTVAIEPASYSNTAKFEWLTSLDGELWEIHVEFPLYRTDIGKLTIEYETRLNSHREEYETRRIVNCDFKPHTGLRIRYSRVNDKTPNNFVVYWLRALQKPLYPAMVKETA
jgi:hypothetical protein